jgi:hypothetical protein
MKKIILLAGIVFTVFSHSFAQSAVSKKSYIIGTSEKSFTIGTSETLTSLKIQGNVNVRLVIAPNEPNVFINGSERFAKNVKTSIVDGTMIVTADVASKSDDDVVVIYAPSLSMLELDGDIQFKTVGTVDADKLQVYITGNCSLTVQHAGKLNIKMNDDYELIERKVTRLKAKV